jgi:hypothetical protein
VPLFPRLHLVIRHAAGAWVDGVWNPALEPDPVAVSLHVQPGKREDYETVQAMPGGQSLSGLLIAFGGTAAPLKEGDVLLYDSVRWRCISAPPPRDVLDPETNHVKYYFTREIAPG